MMVGDSPRYYQTGFVIRRVKCENVAQTLCLYPCAVIPTFSCAMLRYTLLYLRAMSCTRPMSHLVG